MRERVEQELHAAHGVVVYVTMEEPGACAMCKRGGWFMSEESPGGHVKCM